MFCKQCGKRIPENLSFCPFCGYVPPPPPKNGGDQAKKRPAGRSKGFRSGLIGIMLVMILWYVFLYPDKKSPNTDNPPSISAAEYESITTGMHYREVAELIGSPGTEADRWISGSYEIVLVQWKGEAAEAYATIKFQNGAVVDKIQQNIL